MLTSTSTMLLVARNVCNENNNFRDNSDENGVCVGIMYHFNQMKYKTSINL